MPKRIQPRKSSAGLQRALALLAMLCLPAAFEAATGAHGEIGPGGIDVTKAGK